MYFGYSVFSEERKDEEHETLLALQDTGCNLYCSPADPGGGGVMQLLRWLGKVAPQQ